MIDLAALAREASPRDSGRADDDRTVVERSWLAKVHADLTEGYQAMAELGRRGATEGAMFGLPKGSTL